MPNTALLVHRLLAGTITYDTSIVLDDIVYQTGSISYDTSSGLVTINEPGRYLADWWVATQSSISATGIGFEIRGTNIMPAEPVSGNSPFKTVEVTGLTAFEVTAPPATIGLYNVSGGQDVFLSAVVPVKSTLRVWSHDEGGLEYLDDGATFGSLIGIGANPSQVLGQYAVSLGFNTNATGDYSFAEGLSTTASGQTAHAEGLNTIASGAYSHAEGNTTTASGNNSHAEGFQTSAIGFYSHAEGNFTTAEGSSSHAEGLATTAEGSSSHAEGLNTIASGAYSHAEGINTSTNGHVGAHIMGTTGDADTDFSWFLANGSGAARGLAAKILGNGQAYIDGAWNNSPADYAEMFETADGTTIGPGYFVTMDEHDNEKIRIFNAATDQYVLGAVSATPAFVANAAELAWTGKFQTDEWGRRLYHEVEIPALIDENSGITNLPARIEIQPILSPDYDPAQPFIPRSKRSEWVAVGLLGKLRVRDDGSCIPGGYARPNEAGIATDAPDGYRVLARTGAGQVLLLFR